MTTPAPGTTVDLDGRGPLELPAGFDERRTGTIDSRRGEIRRASGGLTINYDIGAMSGLHMHPLKAASCLWFRDQALGDQRVYIGLADISGRQELTITLVPRVGIGPRDDGHSHPANFTALIESNQDLADILLIALSYRPRPRGQ